MTTPSDDTTRIQYAEQLLAAETAQDFLDRFHAIQEQEFLLTAGFRLDQFLEDPLLRRIFERFITLVAQAPATEHLDLLQQGRARFKYRKSTAQDRLRQELHSAQAPAEETAETTIPPLRIESGAMVLDPDGGPVRFFLDKIVSDPMFKIEVQGALIAADRQYGPTLFRQGTVVTRLESVRGALTLQPVSLEQLAGELETRLRFHKVVLRTRRTGAKEWEVIEVAAPPSLARAILARRQSDDQPELAFPLLSRIMPAPFFAADGTFVSTPGYHEASRAYYAPAEPLLLPEPVADAPDPAQVARARAFLHELLVDFRFVSPAEQAHTVALMLAPFVRGLYQGPSPGHMIEKPEAGTGATLLTTVALWPFLGKAAEPYAETDH
jgi:hypothetical protein